jgi:hypothetical protein
MKDTLAGVGLFLGIITLVPFGIALLYWYAVYLLKVLSWLTRQ